jgi:hypothetical protein
VQYLELTECYLFTNEMNVKFDMLGPAMVHRVFCEVNRRYIVTIDHCCFVDDGVKFLKKIAKPGALCSSVCDGLIFCFGTGPRYCGLSLGRP